MAVWLLALLEAWSLQVAVLAATLWGTLALVARRAPRVRLAAWQTALVASLLLPLAVWLPAGAAPTAGPSIPLPFLAVSSIGLATAAPNHAALDWAAWVLAALGTGAVARATALAGGWIVLRRRVSREPEARSPVFDELQAETGVRARFHWSDRNSQPFTVGLRPADIVLPRALASAPDKVLRAVVTHELLHVSRGDWRWVLVEETFCAVMWFHPAAWLLVAEARQAREEVVDRAAVERLGSRRAYMATLLAFADPPASGSLSPVLSFFGSRQLARRIATLAAGGVMSKRRLIVTSLLVAAMSGIGLEAGARAFPVPGLPSTLQGVSAANAAGQAGPLEQHAYMLPQDIAPPRRIAYKEPEIPADALQPGQSAVFGIRLVLDASGHVAEARVLTADIKGASEGHSPQRDVTDRLQAPVLDAVRQWVFERPSRAPLAMTVAARVESRKDRNRAEFLELPVEIQVKHPLYPLDAKKAGVHGSVEVEARVEATGRVSDVRVTKSVPMLDKAAIDAAKASTFRPGMKDGRPVPVAVTLEFTFTLR